MDAYGGRICVGCGESNINVLSIDHVNQDGHLHRKEQGGSKNFWSWLRQRNFPPGYRVLCRNCQWLAFLRLQLPLDISAPAVVE